MASSAPNRFLREIRLKSNEISTSSHFCKNVIHLSKYYWLVIIPHILFEQFLRSSNIWFLISSIFQIAITEESPVNQFTTVAPLAFLLLLALIKDSYADFKLKKQDYRINNSLYTCWNGHEFAPKKCEDIIVGDIVVVEDKQMVPADMLMLHIQNEKHKAFIDMSTLSGVSALKEVKVIEKSSKIISEYNGEFSVSSKFNGKFMITEPSPDYNYFDGKVIITGNPGSVEVGISNLAFRGSYLLGSELNIGLVMYCGNECKILMNAVASRKKSSQIEKRINVLIVQILIVLSMIVSFSLIPYYVKYYEENHGKDNGNREFIDRPNPIRPIITFALLYSYIIPISLFVSIDIVRGIQSHNIKRQIPGCFILNDKINEDLGQIEYILADKTGTITEKQLSVSALIIYDKNLEKKMLSEYICSSQDQIIPGSFLIDDSEKLEKLKSVIKNSEKFKATEQFIKCMCLSNSLIKNQDEFIGSYDETALIKIAEFLEYKLSNTSAKSFTVEINGKIQHYDCIIIRPFGSEQKKSRVVISDPEGKQGFLYIKGERSKIIENLKCPESLKNQINNQVFEMNNKGFRTMVLAYKELSEAEVHKIKRKIQKIDQILLNTESNIEKMMKKLEKNLEFLGITCIEEKISPETIDTINLIRNSGIKLWMVSGDTYSNTVLAFKKSEIMPDSCDIVHLREIKDSYTCVKLLKEYISGHIFKDRKRRRTMSSILDFSVVNMEGNEQLSEENMRKISNQALFSKITDVQLEEITLDREYDTRSLNYVVSLDGESLTTALNHDNCRKMLLLLLVCAKSVCFSALTPIDKGKIVKLLKKNLKFKPIIMSVGLGEGNISLIREADVGISLNQNSVESKSLLQHHSDIIISSFSQLQPLILKHGHWFYFRICRLILLYFYKNFLLTLLLIGFFFKCEYSGTSLFTSSLLVGFNIFFTSFSVLYIGIFDKDLNSNQILENLQVYMIGIMGMYFNYRKFLKYVAYAVMQAGVFLFVFFYFHEEVISVDGFTDDLDTFGTVVFIALVFTVLFQVILETYTFTFAYLISNLISVACLVGFVFVSSDNKIASGNLLGVRQKIAGGPLPFFNIFCSSTICVVFTYVIFKFRELFNPGIIQKIQSVHDGGFFFDRIKMYSKSLSSIYKDSLSWNSSSSRHKFAMERYTMMFKLPYIEKEFRENFINDQIFIIKGTVVILWALLIIWSIIQMRQLKATDNYTVTTYILASVFSVFVFLVFTNHFKRHFRLYISAGFIIGIIVKFAIEVSFSYYSILASSLVPLLAYFLLSIGWFWMHFINLINILLALVAILVKNQNESKNNGPIYAIFMILLISITLISGVIGYFIELSKRKEFRLLNKTNTAVDRTQSILSLLLPPFVKKRVNEGARFIAEPQEEVTILFCDIYNFEQICQENKSRLICEFLDKLFQIFDCLCENMGVTKIETVGKTYMACAGLKESESELSPQISAIHHSRRVTELALAMIQEVKNTRLPNDHKLQVKIGINTGRVVAGVVGYHKPQFSLVGDTVNTASRMCSYLDDTNTIQISSDTYSHIKDFKEYYFQHRVIEPKGKGKMETYLVRYSDPNNDVCRNQSLMLPSAQDVQIRQKQIVVSIKTQLEETLSKISSKAFHPVSYFQCKSPKDQSKSPFHLLAASRKIIFFTLLIAFVTYCLILLNIGLYFQVLGDEEKYDLKLYMGLKALVIICVFVIFYYLSNLIVHWYYSLIIFVTCSVSLAIDFIPMISGEVDFTIANYVGQEIMFIILIFSHTSGLRVQFLILFFSFVFTPWVCLAYTNDKIGNHLSNLALTGGCSLINCISIILRERTYTISTYLKKLASTEIKKTKKLLSQMMPPQALSRLQNNISYTEIVNDVTILFADIVGFTNWCSNRSSEEIIKMLYRVFKRFDKKCIQNDVYKVCTIGDCYVVTGFIGKQGRDPWLECRNVVNMAKSMIKIINKQKKKYDCDLNMRIGIHTGEIIGGIIGSGVVRYDIWGVDVLLANKLESSGVPGKIHLSKNTKIMLEELNNNLKIRESLLEKYPVDILEKYLELKTQENDQFITNYTSSLEKYQENKQFFDLWQENLSKNIEKCKKTLDKITISDEDINTYRAIKAEKILKKISKLRLREKFYEDRMRVIRSINDANLDSDNFIEKSEFVFEYDKKVKVGEGKKKTKTYFFYEIERKIDI